MFRKGLYFIERGGTDSYSIKTGNQFQSLVAGMEVLLVPAVTNTGACTLAVDQVSAKNIKVFDEGGKRALGNGELLANKIHQLIFDGTDFILMNPNIYERLIFGSGSVQAVSAAADLFCSLFGAPGSSSIGGNEVIMPYPGTFEYLSARRTSTGGGTCTVAMVKNGTASTTMKTTIATQDATVSTTTETLTVVAGDRVAIKLSGVDANQGGIEFSVGFVRAKTSDHI